MSSSSAISQFSTGPWTDNEHHHFLRGLEVHGRGNWNAVGMLVRTRNPQQIEAYAVQHFGKSTMQQDPQPAEAINGSIVVADSGETAAMPSLAPGSGDGFFGNDSTLYDWTGVL